MAQPRFAVDVMIRDPKTLAADASVAEVREQLARPRVQMVLLAKGGVFKGAVTALPADAGPADPGVAYIEERPETIRPRASAREAFERAVASPHRRVIVLDDDNTLLGLLCLDPTRTRFCGAPAVSS